MKKLNLFLLLLIPLLFGIYELFIVQNVKDPIKYIYTLSGVTSTIILFFTISISLIKKKINLLKYRRIIGLFGFFYALIHFLNFLILDTQLDLYFALNETIDKPFIYLGTISFLILLFMTITSRRGWYRKSKRYHKLIYIGLILITIHFIMAQKSLNIEQFIYIGIIIVISYCKLIQEIIRRNEV